MGVLPFYRRPIQEINGKLYIIHAEYSNDRIKNINAVREWLGVSNAFKSHKTNTILFCEEIQDVEWEDIT
jgi:hypothetical protein